MQTNTTSPMIGIYQKAIYTQTFALRKWSPVLQSDGVTIAGYQVTDYNPRTTGNTITIRTGVDFNSSYTSQPSTVVLPIVSTYAPVFHVWLPSAFVANFWYQFQTGSTYKPTMTVSEYTTSPSDATQAYTSTSIGMADAAYNGLRVSASVGSNTAAAALTVSVNHRFWEIKIGGITNPNASGNTGAFSVAVATYDYSWLLRSNYIASQNSLVANSYTVLPVPTTTGVPTTDLVITSVRGLVFTAKTKWDANLNINNNITVNAGRYGTYTWTVTPNTSLAVSTPSSTTITTSDTTFKLGQSSVTLSSSVGTANIQIGIPCSGAIPGKYVLFFNSSSSNFLPLPGSWVTVNTGSTGTVTYVQSATSTIIGGSLPVSFTLSPTDYNVDPINVSWTMGAKNDCQSGFSNSSSYNGSATLYGTVSSGAVSTPISTCYSSTSNTINTLCTTTVTTNCCVPANCVPLSPIAIPAGSTSVSANFYSPLSTTTTAQTFTLSVDNACFALNNSSVTVNLSGTAAAVTPGMDISGWFAYKNPSTDTTLTGANPPKLNSLHWVVTPTVFPVNIYCALVCKYAQQPSGPQLQAQSLTTSPLVQQYKGYLGTASSSDIYFNNLVRGQSYAISCYVESTETNPSVRKSTNYTSQFSGSVAQNNTVDYSPVATDSPSGLTLSFSSAPSATVQAAILAYCQSLFSSSTGGIVCQDSSGKTAPGVSLSNNYTCPSSSKRLRVLTTPTPASTTPAPSPAASSSYYYSVYAIPSPIANANAPAASNPTGALSTMKTAITSSPTTFFTSTLGLSAAPAFTGVSTVSDSSAPTPTFTVNTTLSSYTYSTGQYTVVLNYNQTTQYQGYFSVVSGNIAPTATTIKSCTNAALCGNFTLTSPTTTISGTAGQSTFTIGQQYSVFVVFYNTIPNANNPSTVQNVYQFTPACPSGQVVSNGSCTTAPTPTPPSPTPATTNTTATSTIAMSLTTLLAMNVLLFN
jgi:hypothetical protein